MTSMPQSTPPTPCHQFWAGVRAELPIVVGVVPFALIFGVLSTTAGLPPLVAWSTSSIIFAGSAQFLALPLFAQGTPAAILILTTLIINLRHLLYSAALAPYAKPLSKWWKVGLSYLLTDEAFVDHPLTEAAPSMTTTQLMLTIAAMGAVTFLIRLSFIALSDRLTLPPIMYRALSFVPPAVLSAIILPDMVQPGGTLDISWQNPFLLAGIAGIVTAWWSKNVVATMVVGMGVVWGMNFLLSGAG